MKQRSLLSGGLFIIECARFSFLTGLLAVLRFNAGSFFPWQIYAVPNALFLTIALFLWLDSSKYTVYFMLYISGKILSLFSEISSFIVLSGNMETIVFDKIARGNPVHVLISIIIIDFISLIIAFIFIKKNLQKQKPVINELGQNAEISSANDTKTGTSEDS